MSGCFESELVAEFTAICIVNARQTNQPPSNRLGNRFPEAPTNQGRPLLQAVNPKRLGNALTVVEPQPEYFPALQLYPYPAASLEIPLFEGRSACALLALSYSSPWPHIDRHDL